MSMNKGQQNLSAINDAWDAPVSSAEGSDTEMTQLADLPVAVEQAQQAKGGPLNYGKIEFSYKPQKPDGTL